MSATSTKGLMITITKNPSTSTPHTPTAITKASPAVATLADTTGIAAGDLIVAEATGFPELDGKTFVAGAVAASTVELLGSDTTGSAGSLGATPILNVTSASAQTPMCLATIDPAVEAPGTTSVGTFCDPSATIPAVAQAGTLTMTGFVELVEYYEELLKAEADGVERVITITLPQNLGYIIVNAIIGSVGWQLPIDGAVGFTATGAMTTKPRHVFP